MSETPESAAADAGAISKRLNVLRDQFDLAFARPLREIAAPNQNLLLIQAGSTHLALHLSEVAGLHACPKVTPLPSPHPALLGLVGLRGRLLCVYRLAALLSLEHTARLPRWLLVCKADEQLALAIDHIESYLPIAQSALCPATTPTSLLDRFCPEVVTVQGRVRPVLNLLAVASAIRKEAAAAPPTKEL